MSNEHRVRPFPLTLGEAMDWVQRAWPVLLFLFSGGGVMAFLAAATDWINRFGPIAWGLAFFVGAAISLALYWAGLVVARWRTRNKIMAAAAGPTNVNILEREFIRKIIRLADFYDGYSLPLRNKRFTGCKVIGPAILVSDNSMITRCNFRAVQTVLLRKDVPIQGALVFKDSLFTDCDLYDVTLGMTQEQYLDVVRNDPSFAQGCPVISEGVPPEKPDP